MKASDIMVKAAAHMAARASTYDSPDGERSMGRAIGALNSVLGRVALSESEGWLFMQLLKDVRDRTTPTPHADSLEDCVAYAALKAEARLREAHFLAAPESSGIDWSDAPEWAQWVAGEEDENGNAVAFWYGVKPTWAPDTSMFDPESSEYMEVEQADHGLAVGEIIRRPGTPPEHTLSVDWDSIPDWVKYVAADDTGNTYGYAAPPIRHKDSEDRFSHYSSGFSNEDADRRFQYLHGVCLPADTLRKRP